MVVVLKKIMSSISSDLYIKGESANSTAAFNSVDNRTCFLSLLLRDANLPLFSQVTKTNLQISHDYRLAGPLLPRRF